MLVKLSGQIYIARRTLKDNDMVMNLLELNIATVNSEQIHYAVNLHWKDFEDGVKIFTPEEILKVGDFFD